MHSQALAHMKNRKNINLGIRAAFYESTGKKAKTLREAKAHFGIK